MLLHVSPNSGKRMKMNSSDAWVRTHRRNDLLSAICAEVAQTGPDELRGRYGDRIDEVFGDFDDFLLAAFQRWFTAFAAGLDSALESDADDLALAAKQLSAQICRRHPGLWAIVDDYREGTALAPAWARQRQFLLAMAG